MTCVGCAAAAGKTDSARLHSQPASIDDRKLAFVTQTFRVQYCEQEVLHLPLRCCRPLRAAHRAPDRSR